jgi:GST-like protein
MSDPTYTPPRVWKWDQANGGAFANINRPIAGATHDKALQVGKHPLQLYSLATPNGVKVTVMLEELLEKGHKDAEYDAWLINIQNGDQFGSGFVEVNPNSKIPALMDHSVTPPRRVFESGNILLYLAEKFGEFLPTDPGKRTEALSWLFWQMGSAPCWVAASVISMPTPRKSTNTRSIATPWRSNGSWMYWIVSWRKTTTSLATSTPLPTWPSGPGMAPW